MQTQKIKTIIVDDEQASRIRLRELLKMYDCFEIEAEAVDGMDALQSIEKLKPELVFLDIQMPGLNAFEMLAQLKHQPMIVFTTAYDQYALKAFEQFAIDYLLKPIDEERLNKTVKKINQLNRSSNEIDFKNLKQAFDLFSKPKTPDVLPIKTQGKIIMLRLAQIVYLEAKDKYVSLFDVDGKEHLSEQSLSTLMQKFPDYFLRVQKSFVVNTTYIREVRKYFNNRLILIMNDKNNTSITTGTSYIDEIRKSLNI